jgi:hypothetical protein
MARTRKLDRVGFEVFGAANKQGGEFIARRG